MALTVGELVAYIRADSQQFDRAVDDSGRKFSGLASAIGSGVKVLATTFTALTAGAVGVGAAVMRVGLDYNRLQQSSRAALTALLGSAEAANAQMDKLDEWAKTSPFAKQVFIEAQRQLIGFGVEAGRVIPILDAVQNAVAGMGGSNQQIAEVVNVLAKIQSQGKITARELMQLGIHGIDAATLIGNAMGKTGEQVRKEISAGAIGAEQALDALVQGMNARFGNAADLVKQQFDGAVDRVKAAWRDIGSILAAPFVDPKGGGRAVEWANKVADALRALEQKAGPLVDIIVRRLAPGFERVDAVLDRALGAVNRWDLRRVNGQLDTLSGYAPLIAGVGTALFTMGSTSIPVLGRLLPAINPVVAGLAGLVATSPELRALGRDVLDALSPLVPVARDLGKVTADTAMAVLRELTPAMRDLLMAAAPLVTTVGQMLGPAIASVVRAAEPLAHLLAEVVSWVADLPTPVLAAASAFALLHSPLSTVITALGKGLTGALAAAQQTWQASQGVAQALGRDVGVVGTAAITARAGVQALGAALKTALVSSGIGLAIAGITTAIGYFVARQAEAKRRVDELRQSLDEATGAITVNTRALALNRLEEAGAAEAAQRLGISMQDLVDAALYPNGRAAQELQRRYQDLKAALEEEAQATRVAGEETSILGGAQRLVSGESLELYDVLKQLGIVHDDLADAQEAWARAQEAGAVATDERTGAVRSQNDALRENITLQDEASGRALSQREAQLRAEGAQHRVTEAIARYNEVAKDSKATDDEKAAAARAVEEALLGTVRAYGDETDAMARNNATGRELWETVKAQREAFIAQAIATGKSREEAEKLADQYGLMPDQVVTNLIANTEPAELSLSTFWSTWNGRTMRINVESRNGLTPRVTFTQGADGMLVQRFAAGGGVTASGAHVPRVPQIAPGGRTIMWAEPETGWEAYISGKPSMRMRNIGVLAEAADRLGYMIVPKPVGGYADGRVTRAPQIESAPVVVPDRMRLARETVDELAEAILAGARDVAVGVAALGDRAAAATRATPGRSY